MKSAFYKEFALNNHRAYGSISAADLQFGQPVHETHPHLLKAGESKFISIRTRIGMLKIISHTWYHRSRILSAPLQARFQTS